MKRIEQADVISDLIDTARQIRRLLGDRYAVGVVDTTAVVALAELDGSGAWVGVTVTDTPELLYDDGRPAPLDGPALLAALRRVRLGDHA
ncbi:hypothetical protein [Streptomyces sp. S1]|uniref:hypothetical protein n=1 Tax=Streptomyces sp. S1 TaxID=718288 RepID=UPI003D748C5B